MSIPARGPHAGRSDGVRTALLARLSAAVRKVTVSELHGGTVASRAVVVAKCMLGEDVCQLFLEPKVPFDYRAGQLVDVWRPDGLMRSYALASAPPFDPLLELHVKRMNNGRMSGWITDSLRLGDSVDLFGPSGASFYRRGRPDDGLLLVGTGAGLAPLYGIARDALLSGHAGDVHLYHGSASFAGLYLHRELDRLADRYPNFRYTPCLTDEEQRGCGSGRVDDLAFAEHPSLERWHVYLCGAPSMVTAATKSAFLAGASVDDIHAVPFQVERRTPATARAIPSS